MAPLKLLLIDKLFILLHGDITLDGRQRDCRDGIPNQSEADLKVEDKDLEIYAMA